jgi:hypothetical protein
LRAAWITLRSFGASRVLLGCWLGFAMILQAATAAAEPLMFDVAGAEAGFDERTH